MASYISLFIFIFVSCQTSGLFHMGLLETAFLHKHTVYLLAILCIQRAKKRQTKTDQHIIPASIFFQITFEITHFKRTVHWKEPNSTVESVCYFRSDGLQMSQAAEMGNRTWIHLQKNWQRMHTPLDHQDTASHHNLQEHGRQDAWHQQSYA